MERRLAELARTAGESWRVESAGLGAPVGEAIDPATALAAGVTDSDHRARALDAAMIDEAALVLTAARDHRRDVVAMVPAASRRVFTLAEFARLLDDVVAQGFDREPGEDGPVPLPELVDRVASHRGFLPPLDDPAEEDVPDPRGQNESVHRDAVARIDAHIARIAERLAESRRR